jgi:diadenosine tetraphosphate (Ap4A) HIT family hydrolase
MAAALRRSDLPCEGINLLVCDGEAAFQSVFHLHLHVIPRTADDGWTLTPDQAGERERHLLDHDARAVRVALEQVRRT